MKLCLFQLVILALLAFMQFLLPILASVPGLGFPCLFSNITDLTQLNVSLKQVHMPDQMVHAFFFELPEIYIFSFIFFFFTAATAVFLTEGLRRAAKTAAAHPGTPGKDGNLAYEAMTFMASNTVFMASIFQAFCGLAFIYALSFRIPAMACMVMAFQALTTTVLSILLITRGNTPVKSSREDGRLLELSLSHHKLITKYKLYLMNIGLFQLALCVLLFSSTIGLVVTQHTTLTPIDGTAASFTLFILFSFLAILMIEIYLVRFAVPLFGYYMGIASGMLVAMLPLRKYELIYDNLARNEGQNLINGILGMFLALLIVAALLLAFRGYKFWKFNSSMRYRPIPADAEEVLLYEKTNKRSQ